MNAADFFRCIDGVYYAHPLLLLTAVLAGAQVPNLTRLLGYLTRLLRFWR